MSFKYVGKCNGKYTTPLKDPAGETIAMLLWGDPVRIEQQLSRPDYMYARGLSGIVDPNDLVDQGLLEIYVIDVGQGDAVLFRTPDDKWHLMDGGVENSQQLTKKGVANFVRWKFQEDLGLQTISLHNVYLSHPDSDHYGGLINILKGELSDGRTFPVEIENLYHNGLAKFADSPKLGATQGGLVAPFPNPGYGLPVGGKFITELLSDKISFLNHPRAFSASFKAYADLVGQKPRKVKQLTQSDWYVPGYEAGLNLTQIRVLGPIMEAFDGQSGLRFMDSDSKTVNGHSLILLIEYGEARILLTGDLNNLAQRLLFSYHDPDRFMVDVMKGCHHGSEDIFVDFLKALQPRVTIISSGDNEEYSHPRPAIVGASGKYGREAQNMNGKLLPPLVYSTELARSIKLAYADEVQVRLNPAQMGNFTTIQPKNARLMADDWKKPRWLRSVPISTDLIYGLVNVRTDGQEILCATMLEKGTGFDIKVIKAG